MPGSKSLTEKMSGYWYSEPGIQASTYPEAWCPQLAEGLLKVLDWDSPVSRKVAYFRDIARGTACILYHLVNITLQGAPDALKSLHRSPCCDVWYVHSPGSEGYAAARPRFYRIREYLTYLRLQRK